MKKLQNRQLENRISVAQSVADFLPDEVELVLAPPVEPNYILQYGEKCIPVEYIPCPAVFGKGVEEELVVVA